jgi:hypothetical protein
MQKKFIGSSYSTMVEHSPHNPKVKGLSPATDTTTGTRRGENGDKGSFENINTTLCLRYCPSIFDSAFSKLNISFVETKKHLNKESQI